MAYWWESDPTERYWVEITDRDDLGADLKCPQTDEAGRDYWSYSLIHGVAPGDTVYHYSTNEKSFLGASVAGGPVEERPIVWTPHGTVGRSKSDERTPRPGWWRPLYGFKKAEKPLTLAGAQSDEAWVRSWIEAKKATGTVAAPFQLYRPGVLRGAQGYLAKMPREFVERWAELSDLAETLAGLEDQLTELAEVVCPISEPTPPTLTLRLKDESEYLAIVKGGTQRRSRNHERLIRVAAQWLQKNGAVVSTPHPCDLLTSEPVTVLVEAKIACRGPLLAIREAVGQLLEYRYFIGPRNAELGILLDVDPGPDLAEYVEQELGLLLLWADAGVLLGGPRTAEKLAAMGVSKTTGDQETSERAVRTTSATESRVMPRARQ